VNDHEPAPVIQVVMAVRNRSALTEQAVHRARESASVAGVALRWVVYDDGSTDDTLSVLEALLDRQDNVIRGDGTAYWAGGMRQAMSAAAAWEQPFSYLLMLNDDSMLYPSALSSLVSAVTVAPMTMAVGTFVEPGTGQRTYGGARRASRWKRLTFVPTEQEPFLRVDVMNANAVLLTADVFRRLGPLRRPYTHGLADFDFALYARRRSVQVILAADIVGECRLNTTTGEWFNPRLPLSERWALLRSPKGLPPLEWVIYCLRHGSFLGPLYALSPLVRLLAATRQRRNLS